MPVLTQSMIFLRKIHRTGALAHSSFGKHFKGWLDDSRFVAWTSLLNELIRKKPLKKMKKDPAHCIQAVKPPSGMSSMGLTGFFSSSQISMLSGEGGGRLSNASLGEAISLLSGTGK